MRHLFTGIGIAFGQLVTGALAVLAIAATVSSAIDGTGPLPIIPAAVAAVASLAFGFLYWVLPSRRVTETWLPGVPLMTAVVAFWTVVLVRSAV